VAWLKVSIFSVEAIYRFFSVRADGHPFEIDQLGTVSALDYLLGEGVLELQSLQKQAV